MWNFVVTDRLGNPVGELSAKAYDRVVRKPLNGARSLSFRTDISNPLNASLLDAGNTLVRAYRDGVLMFNGPVVTFQESGQDQQNTITYNCMDAAWRMGQLLIGKSSAGYKFGTALATEFLDDIVQDLLTSEADIHLEIHGVVPGTMSSSTKTYVGPWYYKPLLEAIQELSGTLDGFDWEIEPIAVAGLPIIGSFNCADYIGERKVDAAFEFGDGKRNVQSYTRQGTADSLLTGAYSLPSGFPDADPTQTVQSVVESSSFGRREAVVDTDLTVDALRLQLLQEHVRIRKTPRQTIEFTPTTSADPEFGVDYDVGDVVPFRVTQQGEKRIDVEMRIYALEFTIDNEGNESKSLTLAAS